MFFSLTTTWVLGSPISILEKDPRCFTLLVGTVFSNICCQLIVAQMSNTRCELLSWLLIPVTIAVTLSLALPVELGLELPVLYSLTIFTVLAHIHYGVCVVSIMFLNFESLNLNLFFFFFRFLFLSSFLFNKLHNYTITNNHKNSFAIIRFDRCAAIYTYRVSKSRKGMIDY